MWVVCASHGLCLLTFHKPSSSRFGTFHTQFFYSCPRYSMPCVSFCKASLQVPNGPVVTLLLFHQRAILPVSSRRSPNFLSVSQLPCIAARSSLFCATTAWLDKSLFEYRRHLAGRAKALQWLFSQRCRLFTRLNLVNMITGVSCGRLCTHDFRKVT